MIEIIGWGPGPRRPGRPRGGSRGQASRGQLPQPGPCRPQPGRSPPPTQPRPSHPEPAPQPESWTPPPRPSGAAGLNRSRRTSVPQLSGSARPSSRISTKTALHRFRIETGKTSPGEFHAENGPPRMGEGVRIGADERKRIHPGQFQAAPGDFSVFSPAGERTTTAAGNCLANILTHAHAFRPKKIFLPP